MVSNTGILQKTLEVLERKLKLAKSKERSMTKKYELKTKEVEATLLAEESQIMMADSLDLERRAWLEKKQAMIQSHDVWICTLCFVFCLYFIAKIRSKRPNQLARSCPYRLASII
jgi:TPP-dependent indolepyruvate ferredoxin oxidoreductase alpha subunit